MHRDPEIYGDDANDFNPERFLSFNMSASNITFHSFGFGPRMCLGMRLAMEEAKIILAKILHRFQVLNDPEMNLEFVKGNLFFIQVAQMKNLIKERRS